MRSLAWLVLLGGIAGCSTAGRKSQDRTEEVQSALRAQGTKIEACHRKHGKGSKGPFGRMEVILRLDGEKASVEKHSSGLRAPRLERCVLDVLRKAPWPRLPPGERFSAQYPVDFQGPAR